MPRKFRFARRMGARRPEVSLAVCHNPDLEDPGALRGRKLEPDLPPAGEFDIDLGQQFGIEQCAVPGAVAAVDPITGTQRIE